MATCLLPSVYWKWREAPKYNEQRCHSSCQSDIVGLLRSGSIKGVAMLVGGPSLPSLWRFPWALLQGKTTCAPHPHFWRQGTIKVDRGCTCCSPPCSRILHVPLSVNTPHPKKGLLGVDGVGCVQNLDLQLLPCNFEATKFRFSDSDFSKSGKGGELRGGQNMLQDHSPKRFLAPTPPMIHLPPGLSTPCHFP